MQYSRVERQASKRTKEKLLTVAVDLSFKLRRFKPASSINGERETQALEFYR
jgi:peroxiredoxin